MKISSQQAAKLICENFPDNDLLDIPENASWSLQNLSDASKTSGCSLFRFVVHEAYEGATEGDELDTKKFERLLERGIDDIRAIIRSLPDASGFYR